jgi:hypothetical protein
MSSTYPSLIELPALTPSADWVTHFIRRNSNARDYS